MCKLKSNTGYKNISITKGGDDGRIVLRLKTKKCFESILISKLETYRGGLVHTTYQEALLLLLEKRKEIFNTSYTQPIDIETGINYIKKHRLNILGVELDNETNTTANNQSYSEKYIDRTDHLKQELELVNARKSELENELKNINMAVMEYNRLNSVRDNKLNLCNSMAERLTAEYINLISVIKNENEMYEYTKNIFTNIKDKEVIIKNININNELIDTIKSFLDTRMSVMYAHINTVNTDREIPMQVQTTNSNMQTQHNHNVENNNSLTSMQKQGWYHV